MVKLGIIGTGEIVHRFIKQANTINKVKVSCVYSRTWVKAQAVADQYRISYISTELATMVKHINAVYIASPNGLHYQQAKFFLSNNIHVLVEKTITFTVTEIEELIALARENKLILLEAFISVHLPIFTKLKQLVNQVAPEIVNLNFNRMSSRMPLVEQGIYNSVFDQDLGKGSTYDALVYPLQLALYLLGKVTKVKAIAKKLPNNVAISNHVILTHESGTITTITCSKAVSSYAPSEFIGTDSSLVLAQVHPLSGIKHYTSNGEQNIADDTNRATLMTYELIDFIKMINNKDYLSRDYWLNHSLMHLQVIAAIIKNENSGETCVYEK